MKVNWIEVEGFRSFGKQPQRADLSPSLTILTAENSQGKTSFAEAIEFLLTGGTSRRDLHGGSKTEFEGSLRNAHLPSAHTVRVTAGVSLQDGSETVVERRLTSDYVGASTCASNLTIGGAAAASMEDIEFPLSGGLLSAPVLLQHILRYVLNAAPQERADYFKAILEISDLEIVRTEVRDLITAFDSQPRHAVLDALGVLAAEDLFKPLMDPLRRATTLDEVIASFTVLVDTALEKAGVDPRETDLVASLPQLKELLASRHAKVLGIEQFETVYDETALGLSTPPDLCPYDEAATSVEAETTRLLPIFEAVLALPVSGEIDATNRRDCPVCGAGGTLDVHRVEHMRELLGKAQGLREKARLAGASLSEAKTALDAVARRARASKPVAATWTTEERAANLDAAGRIDGARPLVEALLTSGDAVMALGGELETLAREAAQRTVDVQSAVGRLEALGAEVPAGLSGAYESIASAHASLDKGVTEHSATLTSLKTLVREELDRASGTGGWTLLVDLAARPDDVLAGLVDFYGRNQARTKLTQGQRDIDLAVQRVLDLRFEDMSAQIAKWWNTIRPDEDVSFGGVSRRGSGKRFLDLKGLIRTPASSKGIVRDAVSIFSDSQLNALGLAAFLARCSLRSVPFVVLDDPIPGSDTEHRYTFAANTVTELLDAGIQVVVTTFDVDLGRQLSSLHQHRNVRQYGATIIDHTIGTEIVSTTDRFDQLMLAAKDQMNSAVEENRNLAGSKMRRAAERLAKQIIVAGRRVAGEAAADISQYEGHDLDTLHPLVTAYAIQANEPGVWRSLARELNDASHDAPVAPTRLTLKQCHGELMKISKNHPEAKTV